MRLALYIVIAAIPWLIATVLVQALVNFQEPASAVFGMVMGSFALLTGNVLYFLREG